MEELRTLFLEGAEVDAHNTTQSWLKLVKQAVVNSNSLPSGLSQTLYASHHSYISVTSQLSENITTLCNCMVANDFPKTKFKSFEIEANTEKIIDINSDQIDKIHLKIENIILGQTTSEEKSNKTIYNPFDSLKAQQGQTKVTTKNHCTMLPQMFFKDKVDNSHNIWVPIIKNKPNSIEPLNIRMEYDSTGNEIGYVHPYETELQQYEPPFSFIQLDEMPTEFPLPLQETECVLVDTVEKLNMMVTSLEEAREIAVDLEHHSVHSYLGFTCLIQITAGKVDFVIDALALREHLHVLNNSFTDPTKLKVFHGANNDVLWLQRDFGVYVVGMFDTKIALDKLQVREKSLATLLMTFCNVETNKKYQTSDWRIRPLPKDYILYAQIDTHYLIYIYHQLKNELLQKDPSGQSLREVFQKGKQLCLTRYNKPKVTNTSHLGVYKKCQKTFNNRQLAVLQRLYKWRDDNARFIDKSPECIMPEHTLIAISEQMPGNIQSTSSYCQNSFMTQNVSIIFEIIRSCRELPLESTLFKTPAAIISASQEVDEDNQAELAAALSNNTTSRNEKLPIMQAYTPGDGVEQYPSRSIVLTLNIYKKGFLPPFERYKCYRNLVLDVQAREKKDLPAFTVTETGDHGDINNPHLYCQPKNVKRYQYSVYNDRHLSPSLIYKKINDAKK